MSADQKDDDAFGPAMAALDEKRRRFVCNLFVAAELGESQGYAARAAGMGTETSSAKSLSVIGARQVAREDVRAAIAEESKRRLRLLPPQAIVALERLVHDPKSRFHFKALTAVLDRSDPVEQKAMVRIEDGRAPSVEETERVLARIAELARRAGLPAPRSPIDAEYSVVEPGR